MTEISRSENLGVKEGEGQEEIYSSLIVKTKGVEVAVMLEVFHPFPFRTRK